MDAHQVPRRDRVLPASPAATPQAETSAPDWRRRGQTLLAVLGVLATLPRVVWSSAATSIGTRFDAFFSVLGPLRLLSFGAAVGVIVVVDQLQFLDNEVEGRAAASMRRATVAVLVVELCLSVLRDLIGPLFDVGDFIYGSLFARIFFYSLIPAAADLAFAVWLGRMLYAQKVQPFLPAAVIVATCVGVAASFLGSPPMVMTFVNFGVVVAVLVEILRVRRVLA